MIAIPNSLRGNLLVIRWLISDTITFNYLSDTAFAGRDTASFKRSKLKEDRSWTEHPLK